MTLLNIPIHFAENLYRQFINIALIIRNVQPALFTIFLWHICVTKNRWTFKIINVWHDMYKHVTKAKCAF